MDIGWKVVSAGAGILSGIVANKAVDLLWRATGRAKPNAEDPTEPLRDAIVFAVVSATVSAVVNEVVVRKAAAWYGLGDVAEDIAEELLEIQGAAA